MKTSIPTPPTPTIGHHFFDGRKYRADELGEVASQRNWWRLATFLTVLWGIVATCGLVYLGMLPKYTPYYIRWDSASGEMQPLAEAKQAPTQPTTIRLYLMEFIEALRWVSVDKELMQLRVQRVERRLTKEGKRRLVEYLGSERPLTKTDPVKVEILTMVQQSKLTWQVRWRETTYSAEEGKPMGSMVYRGLVTLTHRAPRTQDELLYNPAGLFFEEWNWAHE